MLFPSVVKTPPKKIILGWREYSVFPAFSQAGKINHTGKDWAVAAHILLFIILSAFAFLYFSPREARPGQRQNQPAKRKRPPKGASEGADRGRARSVAKTQTADLNK